MCHDHDPHRHAGSDGMTLDMSDVLAVVPEDGVLARHLLGRRSFMFMLVGASGAALTGCIGSGQTGLGISMVSPGQVRQMGLESWERIRAETPESRNPTFRRAAEKVAGRILSAVGQNPRAWEVVVFQGDEANAFALPGNKIGVYEGMFHYATNEAELAAVLGHEIGHNQADHAAERLSSSAATEMGLQLVSVALQMGNIGYANEIAALLGAGAQYGLILPYSRNQELEADQIGLTNMARAGYDPRAAIALWQNMGRAGSRPPTFMSTHPGPEDRIAALEKQMPRVLAIYRQNS